MAKGQREGTRETHRQIKIEKGAKMGGDQNELGIWINDLQENRFNRVKDGHGNEAASRNGGV